MKAIVTGGAGFIGGRLVSRLLDNDWQVCVIDDYSTHASYGNVPGLDVRYGEKVKWFQHGRVQDAIIPSSFGIPDVIFHLASKLGPVGVLKFQGQIADDTITAASKVGDWASMYGVPLIYISTSEVYGSPDDANTEDAPKVFRGFTARSEYAVSKLAAENMLVNRAAVDVRIIRPFNVTGAGQRPEGGFVIPRFIHQALDKRPLTVYAPGTQRRSFTSVHDINDGIMLAYEYGKHNEVYNLGNDKNTRTIFEIAEMVYRQVGINRGIQLIDPQTIHGPDFVEAPEKIPNADKAIRELGFDPKITIEEIIKEAVEYERDKRCL